MKRYVALWAAVLLPFSVHAQSRIPSAPPETVESRIEPGTLGPETQRLFTDLEARLAIEEGIDERESRAIWSCMEARAGSSDPSLTSEYLDECSADYPTADTDTPVNTPKDNQKPPPPAKPACDGIEIPATDFKNTYQKWLEEYEYDEKTGKCGKYKAKSMIGLPFVGGIQLCGFDGKKMCEAKAASVTPKDPFPDPDQKKPTRCLKQSVTCVKAEKAGACTFCLPLPKISPIW